MKNSTDSTESQFSKPIGIAYLIGRLDRALSRRLRDDLAPYGLTVNQYTALSALAVQDRLSNAQLAERSLVSPQAANEMVKTMEAKGWIERKPDPSHGRIIRIQVTPLGHELLDQCNAAVARLEAAMLAELSDEERTALHGRLRGLLRALSAMMVDPERY